jgi:ABC-type lipoprotein export system ATPase subunit
MKVLTGPAGGGKSMLLHLCALDCHASSDWLDCYVPSTAEYNHMDDNKVADILLRRLLCAKYAVFNKIL